MAECKHGEWRMERHSFGPAIACAKCGKVLAWPEVERMLNAGVALRQQLAEARAQVAALKVALEHSGQWGCGPEGRAALAAAPDAPLAAVRQAQATLSHIYDVLDGEGLEGPAAQCARVGQSLREQFGEAAND